MISFSNVFQKSGDISILIYLWMARPLNMIFLQKTKSIAFFPLLGFTDISHKMEKTLDSSGNIERNYNLKECPIRFASHKDAAYLQAYAQFLTPHYERALEDDKTSASVLAYRSGGGTNIHHAKAMFDEIRAMQNCIVVAMDISGFFDHLNHNLLRDELRKILDVDHLEGHHGTVWKNVTRYAWVETSELDQVLGRKRRRNGRICTPKEFEVHVRGIKGGLIRRHKEPYGVPQGTPISGLYANIYLRTFDKKLVEWCSKRGGSYRRYSDDIAVILPSNFTSTDTVDFVETALSDVKLNMSKAKTESATFASGRLTSNKPIQYLGFTFDGEKILIRQSSIDRYCRKMAKGIHAKMIAAKEHGKIDPTEIFKREALARYTHLGQRRNFLTYAYKAAEIMQSDLIKKQVKGHMRWFKKAWRKELTRVF